MFELKGTFKSTVPTLNGKLVRTCAVCGKIESKCKCQEFVPKKDEDFALVGESAGAPKPALQETKNQ